MILIGVGSTNPVKINATRNAFSKFFSNIKIIPKKVNPGISPQPMTDEEMVTGAINRAKKVFNEINPNFGVGLEGGVVKYKFGVFVRGWVAVYDGKTLGVASTASIQIPSLIWDRLSSNRKLELEDIMEEISGIDRIGDKIGAFGFLTEGKYDRERAFEDAIICALAPIIKPNLYNYHHL